MDDKLLNIENYKNPTINIEFNDNDLKMINFLKGNDKTEDQEVNKNSKADHKTVKIELELNEEELKIIDFIGIYCECKLRSEAIMSIIKSMPEVKLMIQRYQSITEKCIDDAKQYQNYIESQQHEHKKEIKGYQDDINNLKNEIIKYNNENKKLKEENKKLKNENKSPNVASKKPVAIKKENSKLKKEPESLNVTNNKKPVEMAVSAK